MWDFVCNFELIKVIYLYITKLIKLFDMTKPQLVKVEALFYVLQQVIKRSCAYFDTAPFAEWGGFEPPKRF